MSLTIPQTELIHDPWLIIGLLFVGICFGVINTLAGGGSILSLPALLFMGISPHAANATNRVAGIVQTTGATLAFLRAGALREREVFTLGIYGFVGGVSGAWASLQISQDAMRGVIHVCLAAIALFTLMVPKTHFIDPPPPKKNSFSQFFWGVIVSFYGGFLQAGIGLLSLYYIRFICGHEMVRGTIYKTVYIWALTLPSLLVFTIHGEVKWAPGLLLAIGSLMGALIGVRLTLSDRGALIIRKTLPYVALLMVTRLIWKTWG